MNIFEQHLPQHLREGIGTSIRSQVLLCVNSKNKSWMLFYRWLIMNKSCKG